ncbi:MAG TPA: tetratricopeptide repeat protein [Bryobacteraceae bacterium]|jgi:tetratricopeptide (TPR) repeat protein|nr:tetratricopeptide repeat protein [Bryobacteraceae bacterium]
MKKILSSATLLAALSLSIFGHQAQQAQPAAQAGPKPKSQKEVDALKKVQADAQANNLDAEITDINAVLENFADTEYKDMLLNMAMEAAQRKGDYGQTVAFGQQIIQANPNDITGRVTLAETIAAHSKDTDLDKDKSVKEVRDYANKGLDLLKTNPQPPAGISPTQWPQFEKQLNSQAHDALGQADELDKKYPDAVTEFKAALDANPANSVAMARLAKVYVESKQYDDAISTADKVLAMADAPPQVKQFAQQQKDNATKLKTTK